MNKKVVLIDGHSILNRAFYGVPVVTNSEGLHTNGIYGLDVYKRQMTMRCFCVLMRRLIA